MKMKMLVIAFFLTAFGATAQWKDYFISVRGDTLNRVDMKGKKQGPWVLHAEPLRGEPGYDEQGYFTDDKKDGRWVRFSLMGDKIAEEYFRWGVLDGKCRYYNRQGLLMREESWRAVDPNKTVDTVDVIDVYDPSKVVDRVEVKLTGTTYKHGTWTYYDPEWGTITKTEEYFLDKLQTGKDDELQPIDIAVTDSTGKKTVPKPQAVLDFEKKNSGKKKTKVRDGRTGF